MKAYLSNVKLVSNSIVIESVDLIYDRLLNGMGTSEYDYRIYIVKNDNINAFASLGQYRHIHWVVKIC